MIDLSPQNHFSQSYSSCPHCGTPNVSIIRRDKYLCRHCRKEWSWRKGTPFEGTKIPKEKAERLLILVNEGSSPATIAKLLRINYYSTLRFYNGVKRKSPNVSKTLLRRQKIEVQASLKEISRNTDITLPVIKKVFSKKCRRKIKPNDFSKINEYLAEKKKIVKSKQKPRYHSSIIDFGRFFKENNKKKLAIDIIFTLNLAKENSTDTMPVHVPADFFASTIYKTTPPIRILSTVIMRLIEHKLLNKKENDLVINREIKAQNHSIKLKAHLQNKLRNYLEKKGNVVAAYRLSNKKTQIRERNRLFYLAAAELERTERIDDREKIVFDFAEKAKINKGAVSVIWNYHYSKILFWWKGATFEAFTSAMGLLNRIGFFKDEFSLILLEKMMTKSLEQELEYDMHGLLYVLLEKLNQFNLTSLIGNIVSLILEKKITSEHQFYPYYLLRITLNSIKTNKISHARIYLDVIKQMLSGKNNERLEVTVSYYECLYWLAKDSISEFNKSLRVLSNQVSSASQINETTIMNLFEISVQYLLFSNEAAAAFFLCCCWLKNSSGNKQKQFNVLFYLRLALSFLPETTPINIMLFEEIKELIKVIPLNEISGSNYKQILRQLLDSIEITAIRQENMNSKYLKSIIDKYFVKFRNKTLTKDIRETKDYAVFRRLVYFEKRSNTKPESLITDLVAYKSNPNRTFHSNPHQVPLLYSYYFRKYEQCFLETKVICKRYPVQVPGYVKRLLAMAGKE